MNRWWFPAVLMVLAGAAYVTPVRAGKDKLVDLSCEQLYQQGKELVERGKRADGRTYLRRYEQRCPREANIEQVKLLIAVSFFEESARDLKVEGVEACRQLITFYPNQHAACECQLRIADYHFKQMRSCDRDQGETHLAVEEYQKLLSTYPDCDLVEQAKEHLAQAYDRLACAEIAVAEFYRKSHQYRAAEHRLDDLLRDYARFDRRCEAQRMHIEVLLKLGERDRARATYARMSEDCSESPELAEAEKLMGIPPPPAEAEVTQ